MKPITIALQIMYEEEEEYFFTVTDDMNELIYQMSLDCERLFP